MDEAPLHPHNQQRETFVSVEGIVQPAPAPRYSRTKTAPPTPLVQSTGQVQSILSGIGFAADELERLRAEGIIA